MAELPGWRRQNTGRASLMDERGDKDAVEAGREPLEGQEEGNPSRTGWRRRCVGMQPS